MRSARAPLLLCNLALGAAIAATYGPRFGGRWGDELAYAALTLAALALLPLWRRRRFTTLVLASAGVWSMVTGVFLVYVSPWIPHGRWMTWWHAVTSVAFLIAFVAHWARNQPRLLGLVRRMAARPASAAAFALAWLLLALLLAASVVARAAFDERDYDLWADLSLVASLLALGVAVVLARTRRARSAGTAARNRARGAVDASLLVAMWAATLSGFLLQYATRPLRADDAYWLTIAWHVGISAILLALALGHAAFNARPLASHAR